MKTKNARKPAIAVTLLLLIAVLAALCCVPLPRTVEAPAVLQPRDAERVYIGTPGVLAQTKIREGDQVTAGQILAELENDELQNESLRVASDLTRAQARVEVLETRQNAEAEAAAQLIVAREIQADLAEQARLQKEEYRSLTVRAPVSGFVIAPPAAQAPPEDGPELPMHAGTPLDPENRGCYLERGEMLCLVGRSSQFDAVALVDETDITDVRVGQQVRVQLEYSLADVLVGQVVELAELNADTAPRELIALHDIEVRSGSFQRPRPVSTLYQVRVAIDDSGATPITGARGRARIQVESETVIERFTRFLHRIMSTKPHR